MGQKITFKQRFRYWFDNTMSRGTPALIGWLGIASVIMILFTASLFLFLHVVPDNQTALPNDFIGYIWLSLVHSMDAGTVGNDTGQQWQFLVAMLTVSVGGIFIVSTLIGVLTNAVQNRVDEMRKGRSTVLETGHTLVLGWSDQIFIILAELVLADANRKRACVVILAPKDKVEMEDAIRERVGPMGKTRIVCRRGDPINPRDLDIVNPNGARSIIVLSPAEEEPDSQVIKAILAITNSNKRRAEPYHIVAAIHNPRNVAAAHLVGGSEAQIVDIGDTIAKVIVQTCRQSGLSMVYTELLDFNGDEIYFQEEPLLVGKTFGEATLMYEDSVLVGLQFKDRHVDLNPPADTVIAAGDKVISISEDDGTVKVSSAAVRIDAGVISETARTKQEPERTLLLGWNRRAPSIINELDNYLVPGSSVTVVADYSDGVSEIGLRCPNLRNVKVDFRQGDTTDRTLLDTLDVAAFQHVIVLCYSDTLDVQRADARTLITLLHLRDIEARIEGQKFSIVSEMLDDHNRRLAEVTKADDFIVSDRLISLLLAQISENASLTEVFADLFSSEGAEIYLKPAGDYILPGHETNFYTVVEAARRHGEVAIGYKRQNDAYDANHAYGVVVNPIKSRPVTFAEGDRIIVLAEK